ncbi:hypothetical protein BJY01DRAFT_126205 [Aspergillus pseudoustus]|uniref:Uncharacterized protein n=1 Tax=Aspergillus pseudoustus TaxID=1810923 RepID=A0ABR4KHK6_9EURO
MRIRKNRVKNVSPENRFSARRVCRYPKQFGRAVAFPLAKVVVCRKPFAWAEYVSFLGSGLFGRYTDIRKAFQGYRLLSVSRSDFGHGLYWNMAPGCFHQGLPRKPAAKACQPLSLWLPASSRLPLMTRTPGKASHTPAPTISNAITGSLAATLSRNSPDSISVSPEATIPK